MMTLQALLQALPYELVSLISECSGVDDRQKELSIKAFHNIRMFASLRAIRELFNDYELSGVIDYANPVLFTFGGPANSDSFPYFIEKVLDISNNKSVRTRFSDKYYYYSYEDGRHEDYNVVSYDLTDDPPSEYYAYDDHDGLSRTTLHRVYHVMCRSAYSQNHNNDDTFRASIIRDTDFSYTPEFTVVNTSKTV